MSSDEQEWPGGKPGSLGWIRLCHVSHEWRNLMLSRPKFWAKDVGILPRAFDNFVQNSGSMVHVVPCIRLVQILLPR